MDQSGIFFHKFEMVKIQATVHEKKLFKYFLNVGHYDLPCH